jgi:hypothetical protein
MLLAPSLAKASSGMHGLKITPAPEGPIIEFTNGDYVLADGVSPFPSTGWARDESPRIYRAEETRSWRVGDFHTLWGRFTFDRSALGTGPIALYTVGMRSQFDVIVNGENIYRNYAKLTDQKLAWYRPFLVPIPPGALRSGRNEILVRAVSQDTIGVGRIVLGPNGVIQDYFNTNFFWRVAAPATANVTMLVLGLFSFLLWAYRRRPRFSGS